MRGLATGVQARRRKEETTGDHALIKTDTSIQANRERQTGHTVEGKTAETPGMREESR